MMTPAESRAASFDSERTSPGFDWLASVEEGRKAAAVDLDEQVKRAASGRKMQVADALRLRHDLNTHLEMIMLYKKVADTVTIGVQTLARGN
jgi:hypothetical protein